MDCSKFRSCRPQFSAKWPTCFATSLWWIWRWRNNFVFGKENENPFDTGAFIRGQTGEIWDVFSTPKDRYQGLHQNAAVRKEVQVRWIALPPGWCTLNTHGEAKGSPGLAGGSGVIRDDEGQFIKGFAANFSICHAYRAEFLALKHGLKLAKQLGIMRLVA
uniref:RNase H type-1 domain-containing protein n=1 Tax=Chenopodium quinoa TaxID=63459 RepID=A0A803M5E0_CHEQI